MAEETIEALRRENAELREKLALAEQTRNAAQAASSRDLTDARFVRYLVKHAPWLAPVVEGFVSSRLTGFSTEHSFSAGYYGPQHEIRVRWTEDAR